MPRRIKADTSELEQFAKDIVRAKRAMLGHLAGKGYEHLRAEVPYELGNLRQGVAAPEVDYNRMRAVLTVSARVGATGPRVAEVFNAKGERIKTVTLRPRPAYDYAEVVARGNRQATMSPTHAKAFLIPVSSVPREGGYLKEGGQIYVVRRSRAGQKANPYDERAAVKLERDMPAVARQVLEKFV